jgi:hypothetical protein
MEKDKKMIIILSVTSGVLLLLLLISSGYNYKQYNDNNKSTTSYQSGLGKQQSQLKELINVLKKKDPNSSALPNSDEIDCLLKQVNQKYTPFDVLYNIISFMVASFAQIPVEGKDSNDWIRSVTATLKDMGNVGCGSVKTCNIPSSSQLAQACQQQSK